MQKPNSGQCDFARSGRSTRAPSLGSSAPVAVPVAPCPREPAGVLWAATVPPPSAEPRAPAGAQTRLDRKGAGHGQEALHVITISPSCPPCRALLTCEALAATLTPASTPRCSFSNRRLWGVVLALDRKQRPGFSHLTSSLLWVLVPGWAGQSRTWRCLAPTSCNTTCGKQSLESSWFFWGKGLTPTPDHFPRHRSQEQSPRVATK